MVKNQAAFGVGKGTADNEGEAPPPPRYFVSASEAEARRRSISLLVAGRRCYTCQQADDEGVMESTDAQPYIEQIAEHCGQTPDYLLPDNPLKEAIFRVILAAGNEPRTAEEISQVLSERWGLTAYPRDISVSVIQRLLDHIQSYCITKVPEEAAAEAGAA